MSETPSSALEIHPATRDRWDDLERLFGANGACGGCWCQVWRLPRKQFDAGKGAANKQALRQVVTTGPPPGLLGYLDGQPVAWCAVAPRGDYPALARSRILKPVDETPVWSVSCLFIDRRHRRKGLSVQMLRAAVAHVRRQGGKVVEGYPIEPIKDTVPAAFAWVGLLSAFRQAGFAEVARRSDTRPIVRCTLDGAAR